MAAVRVSVIPSRLSSCPCPIRLQRRWARVHDVRFVTTRRDSDRILEKYRAKLDKKAKEWAGYLFYWCQKLKSKQRRPWIDPFSQKSISRQDLRVPSESRDHRPVPIQTTQFCPTGTSTSDTKAGARISKHWHQLRVLVCSWNKATLGVSRPI